MGVSFILILESLRMTSVRETTTQKSLLPLGNIFEVHCIRNRIVHCNVERAYSKIWKAYFKMSLSVKLWKSFSKC